jgi:hypothetical protein
MDIRLTAKGLSKTAQNKRSGKFPPFSTMLRWADDFTTINKALKQIESKFFGR